MDGIAAAFLLKPSTSFWAATVSSVRFFFGVLIPMMVCLFALFFGETRGAHAKYRARVAAHP